MSDPTGPAGWFPDPHGRYEHRWFNGHEWTNDVATDGRRFVDTGGRPVAPPTAPRRRAPGVGAFALALLAIVMTWMPFFVVIGIAAALVALILAARAVRSGRANSTPTTGFTIAALVLGGIALPLSGVGIWLSVVVWGEVKAFLEPGPLEASITECSVEGTVATATGVVTNLGDTATGYTVTVHFLEGATTLGSTVAATASDAVPGESVPFTVTNIVRATASGADVTCEVADVRGPFPFGVEISPPTSP